MNGLALVGAWNDREQAVGTEKARHGNGECCPWHLVDRGEGAVDHLLLTADGIVKPDNLDVERIVEVSDRRIVEGDVAVAADAEADDVYGCSGETLGIIARALLGIGVAFHQMDSAEGQLVEDASLEPGAEALRRVGGKADILVHMERRHTCPVDAGRGDKRFEHFVLAWGGGEDDTNVRLPRETGTQLGRDVVGCRLSHLLAGRKAPDLKIVHLSCGESGFGHSHRAPLRQDSAREEFPQVPCTVQMIALSLMRAADVSSGREQDEQMGKFIEDFAVGDESWSPGRTITEADVAIFAGLSGDFNPAHMDHDFAKKGPFGRPIAHGLLALIISAGLADRDGSMDGTAVALIGIEWKFLKPVFFGDTIRLKISVRSTRMTSKGDRGILVRGLAVMNQSDEVVQEGAITTMMKSRSAA